MRTRSVVVRLAMVAALAAVAGGCNWRMFESIRITATPEIRVPGGTVRQRIADIPQIADLETQIASVFDSGERIATNPYTYRGTHRRALG